MLRFSGFLVIIGLLFQILQIDLVCNFHNSIDNKNIPHSIAVQAKNIMQDNSIMHKLHHHIHSNIKAENKLNYDKCSNHFCNHSCCTSFGLLLPHTSVLKMEVLSTVIKFNFLKELYILLYPNSIHKPNWS